MKQITLSFGAFCIVRSIFWFGGIDIMARNWESGLAMLFSVLAGVAAFSFAKIMEE